MDKDNDPEPASSEAQGLDGPIDPIQCQTWAVASVILAFLKQQNQSRTPHRNSCFHNPNPNKAITTGTVVIVVTVGYQQSSMMTRFLLKILPWRWVLISKTSRTQLLKVRCKERKPVHNLRWFCLFVYFICKAKSTRTHIVEQSCRLAGE